MMSGQASQSEYAEENTASRNKKTDKNRRTRKERKMEGCLAMQPRVGAREGRAREITTEIEMIRKGV